LEIGLFIFFEKGIGTDQYQACGRHNSKDDCNLPPKHVPRFGVGHGLYLFVSGWYTWYCRFSFNVFQASVIGQKDLAEEETSK
jgi:hypothetical protein